jgi:hypothetical protein
MLSWNYSKYVNETNNKKKIYFEIRKYFQGLIKITDMVLAMIE